MDAETLRALSARYHRDRDLIRNEEQTKQSLVIPFVRGLGYDPTNPREVRLEYAAPFTAGDGKRYPDRMDFAIFDPTGEHPLLAIETKPLGADVKTKSPQLARYLGQLHELRFGIMTDGCQYLFYGDLTRPNIMDETPFFQFALDDAKLDFAGVATFLAKFSRGQFASDQLVTEAEDSRYRQGMLRKLAAALQDPAADESFVRWLSDDVYAGSRTRNALDRLGRIAMSAIKPAMVRVLSDDFLNELREQILEAAERNDDEQPPDGGSELCEQDASDATDTENERPARGILTTGEELAFADAVRGLCVAVGKVASAQIHQKDTVHYYNVSYLTPTRWFVRYFGDKKRKAITTLVPTEEARSLAEGFDVEDSPPAFGISRIYVDGPASVARLEGLILRSLAICRERKVAA